MESLVDYSDKENLNHPLTATNICRRIYSHIRPLSGRHNYVYVFTTSKVRFLQNYFLHKRSRMFTKITIIYKKFKN